jgi:hypothetical protein
VFQDAEGDNRMRRLEPDVVGGCVQDLGAGEEPAGFLRGAPGRLDADVANVRPAPEQLDEVRAGAAAEVDDPKVAGGLGRNPVDQL